MHQSIFLFSLELGTSDASGVAFLSSWAPSMLPLPLRHLELGTCPASSWASLMPGVGHLSCLELGTSHASSWGPLMLQVGHLSCFDLGTFEASSWAPTFDASSWAPLMPRVDHLSCFELGAFDASSWAPLMPGVGHLACLELGFLDASSWTPLMPGDGFLPAVGHLMHQSILLFSLELGTSDASGAAFLSSLVHHMRFRFFFQQLTPSRFCSCGLLQDMFNAQTWF